MTRTYGSPYCGDPDERARSSSVAVAGYGKLGGLELGYGSDLDLVFLHDSRGRGSADRRRAAVDNGVFFLRLGQRIVHLLTMHSAAGRLYEVDMRLRPNGKGGFLITGIDAFEPISSTTPGPGSIRRCCGRGQSPATTGLCRRFEAVRRHALCTAVHRGTLRKDVARHAHADAPRAVARRARGVRHQAGCGRHRGHRVPGAVLGAGLGRNACRSWSTIPTTSASSRDWPPRAWSMRTTARWLKEAYIGYRTVLHHLSLEGGQRVVDAASARADQGACRGHLARQHCDSARKIEVKRERRIMIQPNAQHQYTVTPADLPLSCPCPTCTCGIRIRRCTCPSRRSGWAKCAYCGAEYTLCHGAQPHQPPGG